MKHLTILFLLLSIKINAQTLETFFNDTNKFLAEYVIDGKVDYEKISENQTSLDHIINMSNELNLNNITDNQYKALWVNLYNLCVIKVVVNNIKINSPLDVNGFFDKIVYRIGGRELTLNDIENQLLRKKFDDARLHFVLVCGAIGCPELIDTAYTPEMINQQLDTQTIKAINNPEFIRINRKKKRIAVSEIFKWYKEDFTINGTEIDFINLYLNEPIPSNFKLGYYSYNWKLNKKSN